MMDFAAVDWGTTRFRLWLVSADGHVLKEVHSDEGLTTAATSGFEAILEKHLKRMGAPADLPVVVCGMAGARQGWKEARYVDAPANLSDVLGNAVGVESDTRDIRILPGIAQRDPARPDVMRGEETQLLGAISADTSPKDASTVCIPGTHSKWVSLEGSRVRHFATYMTGDLYAALAGHTILSLSLQDGTTVEPDDPVFLASVARSMEAPENLNNTLFSLRSSQLLGYAAPYSGRAGLSGTLIGMELAGALPAFHNPTRITLLGSGRLCDLYESALNAKGIATERKDAERAGLAGLVMAARRFWGDKASIASGNKAGTA